MKFTYMGFSQKKLVEYELDLVDTAILRFFIDFKDSGSMVMEIVEDKPYYWLEYENLIKENPIIRIKSRDALRKRLKKMVDNGILVHYHKAKGGSYSFYGIGENYKYLLFDPTTQNREGAIQKSEPYDSKSGGGTTQNQHPYDSKVGAKDSFTKHSSTKDSSTKQHTKKEIEEVMCVLDKKITFKDANKLLKTANGNIEVIKEKYEVAKATGYKTLMGFMTDAIKDDWQMPKSQQGASKEKKTDFHNFEQRTRNYTPEELEKMVLNKYKNKDIPKLVER